MNAHKLLEPDRDEIEIFFDAVFRHAAPEGIVSLSAYYDDKTEHFQTFKAKLNGGGLRNVCDMAEDLARRCANERRPAVFAPPAATFNRADGKGAAGEESLKEGLALVVDLDGGWFPAQALAVLEALLGQPTLIVKSGGIWTAPDGQAHDKIHAYWRLRQPAVGADLAKLKEARKLATALVGADPACVPVCHGLRCPGSYHRKDTAHPRLCVSTERHPDREIDLDAALAALKKVAPIGASSAQGAGQQQAHGAFDWSAAYASILNNIAYHPALLGLADAKIKAGLSPGATVNDLRALMNQCPHPRKPTWQQRYDAIPQYVKDAVNFIPPQTTPALQYFNAGLDIEIPPPREWLLSTVFCRTFLSSLIAPGATGKSALRYSQAIALASGRELTGEHIFLRCRVGIVTFEDDIAELRRRIAAVCIHHQVDRNDLNGWLFYCAPKGLKLAEIKDSTAVAGALDRLLRDWIKLCGLDVIILDPFIKTHGIPENDIAGMDFVCGLLTAIATDLNVAVDAPHHNRKGAATPGDADRARGASSIVDASRLVYTLTAMSSEEASLLDISDKDRRAFIRVDNAKVNLAPVGGDAQWFKLIGIPLGNETGTYPAGDIVQTVIPWAPPEIWADVLMTTINQILTGIAAGMPNGQRYSDAAAARRRAAWAVVRQHCPTKPEAHCRRMINTWVRAGVLFNEEYDDPVARKPRTGLRVDESKRPGNATTST